MPRDIRDPEASKAKLVDGWFRTGDIVHVDEDGWFHFHSPRRWRRPAKRRLHQHVVGRNRDHQIWAVADVFVLRSGDAAERKREKKTLVAAVVPRLANFSEAALIEYCHKALQRDVPEIVQVPVKFRKPSPEKPIERACIEQPERFTITVGERKRCSR